MSKQIELSPRLRMVADFIPHGSRLVDVGTDHAYLPAALVLEGKIPSAIAADVRQGPLGRAKITVQACGLTGQIAFRLCDGLSGIQPEEADVVVIAGMGGETIAAILAAAPWTREQELPLVLQPMSTMAELRIWLVENGYQIRSEALAQEGETLYTALLVGAGEQTPLTPAELWAGKNTADPLRGRWLEHWLRKVDWALKGLAQGKQEQTQQRRIQMETVQAGLMDMKKEWDTWQQ